MKVVKKVTESVLSKDVTLAVHTRRVNSILLMINWLSSVGLVIGTIITERSANNPVSMSITFLSTLLCTFLFLAKKNELITANIICYTTLVTNFINNYNIRELDTIAQILAMAYCLLGVMYMTAYLNKKSFIIFAVAVDIVVVSFIVRSSDFTNMVNAAVLVNISLLVLFFVTKWGGDLITAAEAKGRQAIQLLEGQQKMTVGIEKNTSLLNSDISECNTYLQSITQANGEFVNTVQEVTKGVTEQAGNLTDVNHLINNADEVITETAEVSYKMSKVSDKARSVVLEGAKNIAEMKNQMIIIDHAVSNSFTTVSELQRSMDEINTFVDVITGIAEQTNLLSLNAAIEAARAGEHGKGFAVVASEVRQLADQSVKSAGMINNIITDIKHKSQSALNEVEAGNAATKNGEEIVKIVNISFENIQKSFNEIDSFVEKELKAIEKTAEIFKQVRMEVTNVANISEEHSAASEEMLSSIQELSANIENIFSLMKQIQTSCESLEKMTKQTNVG